MAYQPFLIYLRSKYISDGMMFRTVSGVQNLIDYQSTNWDRRSLTSKFLCLQYDLTVAA